MKDRKDTYCRRKDRSIFKTVKVLTTDVQENVKYSTLNDQFLPISLIPFQEKLSPNFL